ncbi:hypothetical protein [Roseateles sp. P5_E7]
MFIVWGKKIVRRKLGHVADFCPICRTTRAFKLVRVGSAGHVYYISSGEGELLGHERACTECGTTLRADPSTYASVAKARTPLPELIAQTYPSIQDALSERFALESRVAVDLHSLSVDERGALIREPFMVLSGKVEERFSTTHIDKEMALAIVAALVLLIVGPASLHGLMPGEEGSLFLIFGILGLGLVVWQGIQSGRRFMQKAVLPLLARALHPLRPTEAELDSMCSALRVHGHKLGRRMRTADLMSHLARCEPEVAPAGIAAAVTRPGVMS